MEIRTMLIVAAVTCCAVALTTGTLTYKYTSQHYELQISNEHLKQQTELANLNAKVVIKERDNANIKTKLDNLAIEYGKEVEKLNASLAKYKLSNGGLLIKSTRCEANARVANPTPVSNSTGTSTTPGGFCELQSSLGELLTKTFNDADSMRGNLLICKEYAEAIDKQRKEIYNSKD